MLSGKRSTKAEIDLVAYKDGQVDLFEVKCSYRYYKARRQLFRIRKLLNIRDARLLFYCGAADTIFPIAPDVR